MGQYVDDLMRDYKEFIKDKDANEYIYRRSTDDRTLDQLEETNALLSGILLVMMVYGIVKVGLSIGRKLKKSEKKN